MRSLLELAAIAALGAACVLVPAAAHANVSDWEHNGSLMTLEESGKKRKIVYTEPRSTLNAAGVKQGTVLFDGEEKADGRMAGYAKLFRAGCDPVDYFVEGAFDKTKGEILLQGQAPIYSGEGCKITGYSDDNSASSLVFRQQGGGGAYAARTDEPQPYEPDPAPDRQAAQPAPAVPADEDPAYQDPRDRAPAYGRRADDPRYAGREEADRYRYGRYDRYSAPPADPEDDVYYEDDEEEDSGYVPYQPFWRWGN
jgi:hypothetical protein